MIVHMRAFWLRSAFALLTCLFLVAALLLSDPSTSIATGSTPDFSADRLGGDGTLSIRDLRGEVILLNVWATWCGPCKEEMPELQALSKRYSTEGLHVVGVSIDIGGDDARIQSFADELGVTFTLLRDEDGDFSRTFRTSGVPETVLIDRAGNIAYQWKGELQTGSLENREIIETALASSGAVESGNLPRVATIGFLAAFAAGLLSVLSPCVFPLIPTYATYITGVSIDEVSSQRSWDKRGRNRWLALRNGLIFVSGFSLVFITLGASASAIGGLLHDYRDWIARIGGVLLLIMGLHMLGAFHIPVLDRIVRPNVATPSHVSKPLGTLAIGMAFGAGWTPCIGPALASILTLAAATASMAQGVALLTVYSLGLAVPFLLSTMLIDRFMRHRRAVGPWLPRLERASAILIICIGVLMISGIFGRLASFGTWIDVSV